MLLPSSVGLFCCLFIGSFMCLWACLSYIFQVSLYTKFTNPVKDVFKWPGQRNDMTQASYRKYLQILKLWWTYMWKNWTIKNSVNAVFVSSSKHQVSHEWRGGGGWYSVWFLQIGHILNKLKMLGLWKKRHKWIIGQMSYWNYWYLED